MNLQVLRDEITNDTLVRGYAGMTDAQVADSLNNTIDRDYDIHSMTGAVVFSYTDSTEFAGLSDAKKAQWLAFCAVESIDPHNAAVVAIVTDIVGNGPTRSALAAARTIQVSRAKELGLGRVNEGDVRQARA